MTAGKLGALALKRKPKIECVLIFFRSGVAKVELVNLSRLAVALTELTGGPLPSYPILWRRVASGIIPSVLRNNRHYVDLRAAAVALGLIAADVNPK
jgi:hypothetical protein